MSTSAKLALGTIVKRGDGAGSETFTRIGECIEMPDIGLENPLVDVTYTDATAREYIAGIPDGMELSFAFNYLSADTQQAGLITDVQSRVNRNFQVTVPAASTKTLSFTGTCLMWALATMFDKQIILRFKCKVSGGVTIA